MDIKDSRSVCLMNSKLWQYFSFFHWKLFHKSYETSRVEIIWFTTKNNIHGSDLTITLVLRRSGVIFPSRTNSSLSSQNDLSVLNINIDRFVMIVFIRTSIVLVESNKIDKHKTEIID